MWRKIQKFLSTAVPGVLLFGYLAVTICLLNRWDVMVAVTLIPVWAWCGAGALISLLCWIACRSLLTGLIFCLFLVTAVGFSEEPRGIIRELADSMRKTKTVPEPAVEGILRVVNVDCAGTEAALRKAAESRPDILVVQRAPAKPVLDAVADELFGVERTVSLHNGNAILARGESLATLPGSEDRGVHARIRHPGGLILDVTGLDLEGCSPRMDIWRPTVWKELIDARISHRRLIRANLGENEIGGRRIGRIVAGGFHTPPGDDVYRPLESNGMIDTYAAAGRGWGNTYPSKYPALRLDQVWVSTNLVPVRSVTRLNPESQHRIVVSDLQLPKDPGPTP